MTLLLAYGVLTTACIGIGLLLTRTTGLAGVRQWDVSIDRWFTHRHTGTLDTLSSVGSRLAETPTVVGLALVVVGLVWWRRHDVYAAGILVAALALEVTVFLTTTLFVDRSRPPVHHLDAAPPTSSFPSGHTAAAIVLYIGLILVVRRVWTHHRAAVAVTIVCALLPIAVGLSRLYRGMHNPTDVFAGAALGAVALVVACSAVRSGVVRSGRPDPWTVPLDVGA